jgi:hypothetical protein
MNSIDENKLSELLGGKHKVIIHDDKSFSIVQYEPFFDMVLSVTKPPAKINEYWIVNKIISKQKLSEDLIRRRKEAIEKINSYLISKGLKFNMNLYPTSFGFSIDNFFQDGIQRAESIIKETGIEYKRIEFSDAHWVVRVIL